MIIPNLLVSDIARSVEWYRNVVGLDLILTLDPDNEVGQGGDVVRDAVFATLAHGDTQLMLQTRAHTDQVLADWPPAAPSWIDIRDLDPDPVAARAGKALIRGPVVAWYGMKEIHLKDPDGQIVCVGAPDGPGPGA